MLTKGERVDGSSVFPGAETEASDVYIVPRHRTAFLNPFGHRPSLDVLCSFYGEDGDPRRTRASRSSAGPPRC